MRTLFVAALFALLAPAAWAAGLTFATIPADGDAPPLRVAIWTPCALAAQTLQVGPYALRGQRDCPVSGTRLPLVVISHGHGGSLLNHHDLAETLADDGFVVAALNHPGDNFSDASRAADLSVFVERPTDIKRLIDFMLTAGPDARAIDATRIGFFGFSRGGYTGLVLAGGTPDFVHADVPCPDPALPVCVEIRRGEIPHKPLTHDARIKAYVLADPLNEFPTRDTLKSIVAPVQLWTSQFGGDGVLPGSEQALARDLPQRPEIHAVAGAAHFAFIAPCPEALVKAAAAFCVDPKGFDREALHRAMDAQAAAFLKTHLGTPG